VSEPTYNDIFHQRGDYAMTYRLPDAIYLREIAEHFQKKILPSSGRVVSMPSADADRLNEIADGLEWRPIESAPKDGTQVVLLVNGKATAGWYRYDGYNDGWCLLGSSFVTSQRPKFWRPLPAPPVGTIGGG
jgi:hypothetical protein